MIENFLSGVLIVAIVGLGLAWLYLPDVLFPVVAFFLVPFIGFIFYRLNKG
jgi:uncharacterized membrane protein YjjP (DUF1212 family)